MTTGCYTITLKVIECLFLIILTVLFFSLAIGTRSLLSFLANLTLSLWMMLLLQISSTISSQLTEMWTKVRGLCHKIRPIFSSLYDKDGLLRVLEQIGEQRRVEMAPLPSVIQIVARRGVVARNINEMYQDTLFQAPPASDKGCMLSCPGEPFKNAKEAPHL